MKPFSLQFLLFFAILSLGISFGSEANSSTPSTPASDTLWVDVRTPREYNSNHLSGAINIPLQTLEYTFAEQIPDKNATIALYCRSGNRSGMALQIVQQLGYTNAFNAGGLQNLLRTRGQK